MPWMTLLSNALIWTIFLSQTSDKKWTDIRTYNERLIKSKHYNKLDGQELCERAATLQFIRRQAIKHEEAIQCDASY
jgi:hypothetical protein